MKKSLILLTLALLFCFVFSAQAENYTYTCQVQLIDNLATRSGPGTQFTGCGSYTMKGKTVTALNCAYDKGGVLWVEIDFPYGGATRRAWTGAKRLKISNSQINNLYRGDYVAILGTGRITQRTAPFYGPGYYYAAYGDRDLRQGQSVTVIEYTNDFYQIECYHTDGKILRCWVPAYAVDF